MIISNKINYSSPLQNNVKTQKVAFTADNFAKEQKNVQQNPTAKNVSFLGYVSKVFSSVLDKVYENSTSSEVEASFDLIA